MFSYKTLALTLKFTPFWSFLSPISKEQYTYCTFKKGVLQKGWPDRSGTAAGVAWPKYSKATNNQAS